MKKISIVIVNWNGWKDTLVCLASLQKMKTKGFLMETVIVDNGSSDESVVKISHAFPKATMLILPKNMGFTGGNNKGIEYAYKKGADYVWLLNNDTIVDERALSLVDAFTGSDVGIAGSKIYFAAGHEYHKDRYKKTDLGRVFWYAGGLVDWANMYASHRGVDEVDVGQFDKIEETPFVTGCSMMVARDVISKIGFLDNAYYLYLEDLDYCLRAKLAGFSLIYNPTSVVWHVNAGSSGGAGNPLHDYYITRNRLRIGFRYARVRTKFALLREAVRLLFSKNREKRNAVRDAFLGKWGRQYEPKKFVA